MKRSFAFLVVPMVLAFASISIFAVPSGGIDYRLTVDAADLTGVTVEMRFHADGPERIAMAAHPEYDDRYFHYIENVSASSAGRALNVTREQAAVWRINATRGPVILSYRLRFPPQQDSWRDAWKPFLTSTGGMVGDLHCLMYVVGRERAPARLTLDMPSDWRSAAGLASIASNTFDGTVDLLLDAPVIVGRFSERTFIAAGTPHKAVIWSAPDAKPFNAKPVVDGLKKLVNETIRAFGPPPYRRYAFLIQNGGSAALEHRTSLNVGYAPDRDPSEFFDEVAHEYVHTWNLMDVRPKERINLAYKFALPTGVLWWNEGATIHFADLLLRRSGLPTSKRDRIEHLKSMLDRYLSSPGYWRLSGETVSRGDTDLLALGDDFASTHLQGEVFALALDLWIQDTTRGRRDLTDVQRLLSRRFDMYRGIDNRDLELAIAQTCGCDIGPFFRDYIYGAKQLDLKKYLGLIGLDLEVTRAPALGYDGKPLVDLKLGPFGGDGPFRIRILNSESAWVRAGLKTGDEIMSADGKAVPNWAEFRNWLRTLKIGETRQLELVRDRRRLTINIHVSGFEATHVKVVERTPLSPRQRRLKAAWLRAR